MGLGVLNLLLFSILIGMATVGVCYKTDAPDFSNEPATTLPPLTPQQIEYITLLNVINGNAPGGNQNIVQAFSNG